MPGDDTQQFCSRKQFLTAESFLPGMIMSGGHLEASSHNFVLSCEVYERFSSLLVHMSVVNHHALARHETMVGESDGFFFPPGPIIAGNYHPLFLEHGS